MLHKRIGHALKNQSVCLLTDVGVSDKVASAKWNQKKTNKLLNINNLKSINLSTPVDKQVLSCYHSDHLLWIKVFYCQFTDFKRSNIIQNVHVFIKIIIVHSMQFDALETIC
jgi:hypothetical protein